MKTIYFLHELKMLLEQFDCSHLHGAEWHRAEGRQGSEQLRRSEAFQERQAEQGQERGELRQSSGAERRRAVQFCGVQ